MKDSFTLVNESFISLGDVRVMMMKMDLTYESRLHSSFVHLQTAENTPVTVQMLGSPILQTIVAT